MPLGHREMSGVCMCLHSALCIGKRLFGYILLPGSMHEVKHLCVWVWVCMEVCKQNTSVITRLGWSLSFLHDLYWTL